MSTSFKEFAGKVLPPPVVLPALFSYTIEHIAISIYWIFFGLDIITNLTDSYLNVALVFAIPAMISTVGTMFLSNLSDKTGRRKEIMFLSRIALMAQFTLLIFFRGSIWVILLILSSCGIFTQIYYTMNSALITTICPPDKKGMVASYQVFFASAGWMIGGGVSGIIYTNFGIDGSLRFAAFFAYTAGAIALLSSSKPWSKKSKEPVDVFDEAEALSGTQSENEEELAYSKDKTMSKTIDLETSNGLRVIEKTVKKRSSYRDILFRKEILFLLLTLFILDFGFGPFNVIGSVYLREAGLNNNMISLSNTLATAIGMIILLIAGNMLDRTGRKPIFIFAIAMYPVIYLLMFLTSNFPVAIFIVYLYPLYALKVPTTNAMMADLTASDERARGMSLINIGQIFAANLGAILGCYIADIFPTDWLPKFIPDGVFISPLFPVFFGVIAFIIALKVTKETNKKTIALKIANEKMKTKKT
ncbi:MAG: MFS transporter [Candidatus Heimdallarchaeota archaeon]